MQSGRKVTPAHTPVKLLDDDPHSRLPRLLTSSAFTVSNVDVIEDHLMTW